LLSDITSLAQHGLIEPSRIADTGKTPGFRGIAFDLTKLVEVIRENWKAVEGRTPLTAQKLDEIERLGERLLESIGARDVGPAQVAPLTLQRQKAFTLFYNAYDQIRRVISYFRWEQGDLEQIAPSLYAGRGGKGSKVVQPAVPPPPIAVPPPQPIEAAAADGMPGAKPLKQQ
jgi:hypothetical protein